VVFDGSIISNSLLFDEAVRDMTIPAVFARTKTRVSTKRKEDQRRARQSPRQQGPSCAFKRPLFTRSTSLYGIHTHVLRSGHSPLHVIESDLPDAEPT
jgi:hypothetical protein